MFKIDINVSSINKAIEAAAKAKRLTMAHDARRDSLMLEMAEENVGRIGVEKRNQMIEEKKADLKERIDACISDVEAARAVFIADIDKACISDGSRLDSDDIMLLNANAVFYSDIMKMLEKHKDNFTMLKAIAAYCERNKNLGIGTDSIAFHAKNVEQGLREFEKAFFDKCVSAVGVPYGYNALWIRSRNAISDFVTTLGIADYINIDKINVLEQE